jgi:uncharacterized membrane protein YqjE
MKRATVGPTNDDLSKAPDGRSVLRWTVAGVLALVALVGAMSIVVVFVWAAGDLPAWLTVVLGGGLVIGTVAFAWVIASALRSNDRSRKP